MKPLFIALISIGSVLLLLAIIFLIFYQLLIRFLFTPPKNNPEEFLTRMQHVVEEEPLKRIVFVGDSLTHANLSVSYIDILKENFGENSYHYINAGINAELTYNVLQRLDDIINCKPDIVTILIGTNDAIRELGLHHSKQSDKMLQLPQEATKEWFTENLQEIISIIKKQTKAKIAVCSLPPLGEIIPSKAIDQIRSYSEIIKEIASKNNVIYLPVFEKMIEEIQKSSKQPKYDYSKRLMETATAKKYFFGKSLDNISNGYNFTVLTDQIHLNTKGASIIAELMTSFIKEKST